MNTQGLLSYRLPVDDLYENGRYEGSFVFLTDLPANALALHQFLFAAADEPDEAKVLSPGASLPPRTPTIYQGADGNYYYYATGQMVPTPTPDQMCIRDSVKIVLGIAKMAGKLGAMLGLDHVLQLIPAQGDQRLFQPLPATVAPEYRRQPLGLPPWKPLEQLSEHRFQLHAVIQHARHGLDALRPGL